MPKSAIPEKIITRKLGDVFIDAMTEKGTAGYVWTVTSKTLAFEKKVAASDPLRPAAVGSFSTAFFRAALNTPGTHKVVFTHKRPWEKDAIETRRYTIHVEP